MDWRLYCLGTFVLVIVLAVVVINALILVGFYRLRNCTFVQNSQAFICLISSDLVKALIYIPLLVFSYVAQKSYTHATCVFIIFSFTFASYTSLLHMTAFCIWRLIAAKHILAGRTHFKSSLYICATLALTILAVGLNLIPHLFFENTDMISIDCRRGLFNNTQGGHLYFAVLFDTPIIIMNITVIILTVWYKILKAKVGCCPEEVLPETSQSNYTSKTNNTITAITDINILTMKELNRVTKSDIRQFPPCTPIMEEPKPSLAEITDLDNKQKTRSSENEKTTGNLFQPNEKTFSFSAWQKQHTRVCPMLQSEAGDSSASKMRIVSRRPRNSSSATTVNILPNSMCEHTSNHVSTGLHTTLFHGIRQFLITIGILVGVYDISILPLLVVLNFGAMDIDVAMPRVLISLCFLTSLINPVVYLVRMEKMRKEIKVLLNCGRN